MAFYDWKKFASAVATFARTKLPSVQRGALLIRCLGDGNVVAAVFGNDNYLEDRRVRRELELIRRRVADAPAEELAFGLSLDGYSWALLVRTDNSKYKTQAGKAFHTEMLKVFLDDAVQGAWRNACGVEATAEPTTMAEQVHQSL